MNLQIMNFCVSNSLDGFNQESELLQIFSTTVKGRNRVRKLLNLIKEILVIGIEMLLF